MSSVTSDAAVPNPVCTPGEPTWEVALLFPRQGQWSEADYFALDTKRLVELDEGYLEVLPMPSLFHQAIVDYLHSCLKEFLRTWGKGGRAFFAPVPIRLWPEKLREPDVFFIGQENLRDLKRTPDRIDLAMEVVSEGESSQRRDYQTKRSEYAAARIPEYWIVDPMDRKIIVLTLSGDEYQERGVYGPGEVASSALLPGFHVSVDACFASADQ